jgi:putative bacteriocin precursor
MKKLNKRNDAVSNTIQAYSCYCICQCYCQCTCFCFVGMSKSTNDTGNWYNTNNTTGNTGWAIVGEGVYN